jgi:cytochrome c
MTIRTMRARAALVLAALLTLGTGAARADGDATRGKSIYARCAGCHAIERNRVGPRHAGLFGRAAGSLDDYAYSDAMRASGLVWDAATLDRFLADPRAVVPGTKMGFAGIKDAAERADLIAYLAEATVPSAALRRSRRRCTRQPASMWCTSAGRARPMASLRNECSSLTCSAR